MRRFCPRSSPGKVLGRLYVYGEDLFYLIRKIASTAYGRFELKNAVHDVISEPLPALVCPHPTPTAATESS